MRIESYVLPWRINALKKKTIGHTSAGGGREGASCSIQIKDIFVS